MQNNISRSEKENKIKKVLHLISKAYEHDSLVNEDEEMVHKIATTLKPNQWLRVDKTPYDYSKSIDIIQTKNSKPNGIWASKGEWLFKPDSNLTLLEIDYSRILVLTTKKDLLDFENNYCNKIKISNKSSISSISTRTKQTTKISQKTKSKTKLNKSSLICNFSINWKKVAKHYNGIAFVPNPDWYFPRKKDDDIRNHLWLRTYDVSSLIIWRNDNTNDNNSIINYKNLGKIADLEKLTNHNHKLANIIIIKLSSK